MQSPLKRPRADTDHLKGLSQQQIEQQQQKQRQQQDQQRHGAQRDDNLRQGLAAAPANFKQAAIDHLVARIRDPRSADAAVLPLRPALAPLERELAALLSNVVIGGQNVSLLVIGEPGSGKTLVGGGSTSQIGGRWGTARVWELQQLGTGSKSAGCPPRRAPLARAQAVRYSFVVKQPWQQGPSESGSVPRPHDALCD
jgi:hypothetical protein